VRRIFLGRTEEREEEESNVRLLCSFDWVQVRFGRGAGVYLLNEQGYEGEVGEVICIFSICCWIKSLWRFNVVLYLFERQIRRPGSYIEVQTVVSISTTSDIFLERHSRMHR
jgi:hypothetical protein